MNCNAIKVKEETNSSLILCLFDEEKDECFASLEECLQYRFQTKHFELTCNSCQQSICMIIIF